MATLSEAMGDVIQAAEAYGDLRVAAAVVPLNQRIDDLVLENQVLREELLTTQQVRDSLQDQLNATGPVIETLNAQVASLEAQIAVLEARIRELEGEDPDPEPDPFPVAQGQSLETVPGNVPAGTIEVFPAYFQPGDFAGSSQILWTSANDNTMKIVRDGIARGAKVIWFSFKDGATAAEAAKVEKFLASCPKDQGLTYMVTYFHEHNGNIRDGDLTLEEYKTGSKNVADAAHKHGMLFGPNHNGANLKVVGGKNTWVYDPALWAMHEADPTLYDFWSCDGYAKNYQDPAVLFKPAKDYADSLGLPLCWRETASPVGAQQAAWAVKARDWMRANCKVFCWWSAQKSSAEPNYRLTEASAAAWYEL